ncbi:hypothetical protein GQE99_14480 [Maritimibacter sp. DP07]|uniref:DUF3168 domain-containing protein n=1 Tax=Maritimibacter harenae TaxID=2606218 RepID=A0A845M3T5_9RHOB|nr:hypothetical protein [Maritimibacter harenae]MZR14226.1 hypothetical protein [Maritimibacter harenae]
MEQLVRARLAAQTGVPVAWGQSARADEAPRVVLLTIAGSVDYHMGGASGMKEARVQAVSYGNSYGEAKSTAGSVEAALSGWRSLPVIEGAFLVSEVDLPPDTSMGESLFRVSLDFRIIYQET